MKQSQNNIFVEDIESMNLFIKQAEEIINNYLFKSYS